MKEGIVVVEYVVRVVVTLVVPRVDENFVDSVGNFIVGRVGDVRMVCVGVGDVGV